MVELANTPGCINRTDMVHAKVFHSQICHYNKRNTFTNRCMVCPASDKAYYQTDVTKILYLSVVKWYLLALLKQRLANGDLCSEVWARAVPWAAQLLLHVYWRWRDANGTVNSSRPHTLSHSAVTLLLAGMHLSMTGPFRNFKCWKGLSTNYLQGKNEWITYCFVFVLRKKTPKCQRGEVGKSLSSCPHYW